MNLRDYGFYNTPQDYNDNNSVNYAGKSPVKNFDTLSCLLVRLSSTSISVKAKLALIIPMLILVVLMIMTKKPSLHTCIKKVNIISYVRIT